MASNKSNDIETEIAIVGGGPVGVTLAILLARRGVRSVIVERHSGPYPLPRAVHLDDEVVRILEEVGVADEFRAISRSAPGLRLVDRQHRTFAQFDRELEPASGLPEANLFDQPELELILRAKLDDFPEITTMYGWTATQVSQSPESVVLRVTSDGEERTVRAGYLVGCDGANSWTRAALNIPVESLGFEQRWLVIDGRCSADLDPWGGVYQICDPAHPGTFMRVGHDRYRWEFRLDVGSAPETDNEEAIRERLLPWTKARPAKELELLRVVEYTFKAEVAETWRAGRIFLAGDAAHLTPPFIGQGLGSGLRDARNLAWKLAAVLRRNAPDALLDSYEPERKRHSVALIQKAKLIGQVMTGSGPLSRVVRGAFMPLVARVPALEHAILNSVTPGLASPYVVGRSRAAGALLPRVEVPVSVGSPELDVLDAKLADPLTLISVEGAAPKGDLSIPVIEIWSSGTAGERFLAEWLRARRAQWAIVRTDRTIMTSGRDGSPLTAAEQHVVSSLQLA